MTVTNKNLKLVAILRAKNEVNIAAECFDKLSQVVDEIIVVDNGSTDGTLELYKQYPKISTVIPTVVYDDGGDKNILLEAARKASADWIIWIDADEVFESHFTREVAERYMHSGFSRITFRMCNFWLSRKRFRIDRGYWLYTLHPQRSMWRNVPEAYFKNQKLHPGDIRGVAGKTYISPYRLKHLGFIDKRKMQEKLDNYLRVDKNGDRNYVWNVDPSISHLTFPYFESKNQALNYFYIVCYKYACNLLWLAERARRKVIKFFR